MQSLLKLFPVVFQTFAIYVVLIVSLRTIGRGRLGQLTVIDLVTVLLLGTCVETSMIAFNNSLAAGLVSASTLLLSNWLLSFMAARWKLLRVAITAEPILLITDGVIIREHVSAAGLTECELLEAIREREHADVSEVKYAVLEPDGEINVVPRDITILRSNILSRRSKHKQS